MNIQSSNKYLFSRAGQQYGPYDGDYLLVLAKNGQMIATDHIWTEGMMQWAAAAEFTELANIFSPAAPVTPAVNQPTIAPAAAATPVAGGLKMPTKVASGINRPNPQTKIGGSRQAVATPIKSSASEARNLPGAKFGLIALFFSLAAIGLIGYFAIAGTAIVRGFMAGAAGEEVVIPEFGSLPIILYGVGIVASIVTSILTLVYLHRAWKYVQDLPGVIATPGKAIGFLFIPFFNIYWMFQAYWGWSKEYNRRKAMTQDGPMIGEGLFMTFCILSLLGFGVFIYLPVMAKMCRAINHLAKSPALAAR